MAHPFQKFAAVLKQLAPTVLTAVGGPAGALAATLIKSSMGAGPETDAAKVVEEALASPEGMQKLRLAEIDLQKYEADNGFKFADLEVQDVRDARQHDIEMRKQGDRTTTQLAWLLVGSFVVLSVAVVASNLLGLNNAESTMVGTIIGYLLNESKQVTAFYFGSSRGSKLKDATIADSGGKP